MGTERLVILNGGFPPLTWQPGHPVVPLRGHVDLKQLLVFHRSIPESSERPGTWVLATPTRSTFRLTTCQREVDILFRHSADTVSTGAAFRGSDAYRFLLELATGLLSVIPGETNVFGQLRAGWRDF